MVIFHSYVNVYQRVLFDQQKQEANMASPHAMPAETAEKQQSAADLGGTELQIKGAA